MQKYSQMNLSVGFRKNEGRKGMVEGFDGSQNRKTSIHLTDNHTDSMAAIVHLFTYY